MLLWETSVADPKTLRTLAARATGAAECLVREDGKGGFILCQRGKAPPGVLEKHLTPLFSGGRIGPKAGAWVFRVGIWTPQDWRSEFCAWYQCEHAPILLECPEWQGYQLFEARAERGCQFYVLHHLADRSALDSEWRRRSRSTPWFYRLAKNEWFDGPFERILCRRVTARRDHKSKN